MGTILLIILLFLIYIFVIKPLLVVNRFRRQVNDMFNQAYNNSRQQQAGTPGRQQQPPVKKKKITSDVGEYVAFEEIKVTEKTASAADTDRGSRVRTESQIEDVEWEDIKK